MYLNLFFNLFIILMTISGNLCDNSCKSIIPDAITQLQNGSVVIFQDKNVWFLTLQSKGQSNELSGPCPIKQIFEGMEGPIDAAVTFEAHESVTEFVGASIYFTNGRFFTFRNFRPYEVEWGNIVYLPVKGSQTGIAVNDKNSKELMPTKMSAAFFDPKTVKSKFIFPDGRVLAFNFELGSEFDVPVVSTMDKELENLGISDKLNITSALTLMKSKQLVLFEGTVFCQIDLSAKGEKKCQKLPISDFLGCDHIKQSVGNCLSSPSLSGTEGTEPAPIDVSVHESEIFSENPNVEIRQGGQTKPSATEGQVGSARSLSSISTFCQLILNFMLFSVIDILF